MKSPILHTLAYQASKISGRDITKSTDLRIATLDRYSLRLELPADPDGQPLTDEEPSGPYIGAVLSLYRDEERLTETALWNIWEDFEAGNSADHPWWQHLADIVGQLASELANDNAMEAELRFRVEHTQTIRRELYPTHS